MKDSMKDYNKQIEQERVRVKEKKRAIWLWIRLKYKTQGLEDEQR